MTARLHPLRWPLDMMVELREQGCCALPVRVVDIALDCCRLWAGFRMHARRGATMHITDFAPIGATILWSEAYYAELRFDAALHPAILDHLVRTFPPVDADEIADHIARMEALRRDLSDADPLARDRPDIVGCGLRRG
ncbi:MAG: hypothetical protein OSB00_08475 [Sphingomonas bacterium]|nr:hypothetical protein [Sphingomonas bacterium]